jgi:RNA polymerase sigma factor (sigma-70 family)
MDGLTLLVAPDDAPEWEGATRSDASVADEAAAVRNDFESVVVPHLDAAYHLAYWLARDRHMAEELVQDAILRALQYFHSFRGENGRGWLLQIVRNAYRDAVPYKTSLHSLPLSRAVLSDDVALNVPDPGPDPETQLARKQDLGLLTSALASLPAELRECLVLRELEEMPYKEIAELIGLPIGTVMSRLSRARHTLMERCSTGL